MTKQAKRTAKRGERHDANPGYTAGQARMMDRLIRGIGRGQADSYADARRRWAEAERG